MEIVADGGDRMLPSLSRRLSPEEVTMNLTMCGLLVERAEDLVRLYNEHETWNEVKQVWFEERLANRSTRGSSQKIYSVLSSRFKNAPASLPNPGDLPAVLDDCATTRDKSQVLYFYLVADDALFRYVLHEYVNRAVVESKTTIDFSNETLLDILHDLEYSDGTEFSYADSTTKRWCEGFRSVMREIGVLENQQATVGSPPSLGDIPLLVATGYSYETGGEDWIDAPAGLCYLFQPHSRWEELYDRVAALEPWEFIELHGDLKLQPINSTYAWIDGGDN